MGLRDLANSFVEGLGVQSFGPDWRVKRAQALAAVKHTEAETSQAQAATAHEQAATSDVQAQTEARQFALEEARDKARKTFAAAKAQGYADEEAMAAAAEAGKMALTRATTAHTQALAGAVPSEIAAHEATAASARAHAGYESELTNQLRNTSAGGVEQIPALANNVRAGRLTIPEAVSLLGGGKSAPQLKIRLLQEIQSPSAGGGGAGGAGGEEPTLPVRLTPQGQQALAAIEPTIQQMKSLITAFEPYKTNNTPFHFFTERVGYKFGRDPSTGESDIANQIANLELAKITGAMPYATKSRNFQYIQQIQQHLPDVWKDSPQLIYRKLQTALTNMQRIRDDIIKNDSKGGFVGGTTAGENAQGTPTPPPGYRIVR